MVKLNNTDLQITHLVARFGQLTATQIHQLVFRDITSRTPVDRALNRLLRSGHLARIERRLVGGSRGGSGQYVYQLGANGWRLCREDDGRWRPMRSVSHHSLAIADAFVTIKRLEQDGVLTVNVYSTEPDCHVTIGRHELKPDMYLELARPGEEPVPFWLEIDMGSEGQRQLKDKFARYWLAWDSESEKGWTVRYRKTEFEQVWNTFPLILLVAVDDERKRELRWLLEKGSKEQQRLFRLTTLDELYTSLA